MGSNLKFWRSEYTRALNRCCSCDWGLCPQNPGTPPTAAIYRMRANAEREEQKQAGLPRPGSVSFGPGSALRSLPSVALSSVRMPQVKSGDEVAQLQVHAFFDEVQEGRPRPAPRPSGPPE